MFIVIDGPDGSGKTTLAKCLVERLNEHNRQAVYTYEPTHESSAGRTIRQLLQGGEVLDPYAFSDLFVEDRKEHMGAFILPQLSQGNWVVCDRYKYSALAYQQLQGVDARYLVESNREFLIPDAIFILIPHTVEVLMNRISARGAALERFEQAETLKKAVHFYQKLSTYFPEEHIIYLNAELAIDENLERIHEELCKGTNAL